MNVMGKPETIQTRANRIEDAAIKRLSDALDNGGGFDPAFVHTVEVLRTGQFNHPWSGEFKITRATLDDFVRNFDSGVRRVELAVDYGHAAFAEAAGWITSLSVNDNGDGSASLLMGVQWTPKAAKMLRDREYRYLSAEFAERWTDEESGHTYNNVLFGAGLTNRPFVKDMAPVAASEGADMKDLEQAKAEIKRLEGQVGDLNTKLAERDREIGTLKADLKTSESEVKALKEAAETTAKNTKFDEMLRKGSVIEAQREAYVAGDIEKFSELAGTAKPNLRPAGSSAAPTEENEISYADADAKLTDEAYKLMEGNSKLTFDEALERVEANPDFKKYTEAARKGA